MSRRNYRQVPRRRRDGGMGCGGCLGSLIMFVALAAVLYAFLGRDQISRTLGEQVGQQLGRLAGAGAGADAEALAGQADTLLPSAVAALPSGEIVLSADQINALIAANPAALAPLDAAELRFANGQVEADISAYGMASTMRAGLTAQAGQVALVNPQIDGPLGVALSASELALAVENRINSELAAQARAVQDIRVEEGQIVAIVQ
jgi:hypothetical protein